MVWYILVTLGTWLTAVLAFAFSYLGCLLGLVATARARRASGPSRARWLVLGAWAIGGTGIWVMHFVAMIGFTVNGADVNYDVSITLASCLIAVLAVGAGLFIVGYSRPSPPRVLAAGLLTGLGVAAMHYAGVAAMRMNAGVGFDRNLVWLSIAIAVVAATAALWFTVTVRRARWITIGAAIMAVAVNGMHYTGMAAMSVHASTHVTSPSGISALEFLPAILVFVLLVGIVLSYALLIEPTSDDRRDAPAPGAIAPRHTGTRAADRQDPAAHSAFPPRQPASRWPEPDRGTPDPRASGGQPPAWRTRL
jgi:NO-binding membrane sensor protein with MHYT domain